MTNEMKKELLANRIELVEDNLEKALEELVRVGKESLIELRGQRQLNSCGVVQSLGNKVDLLVGQLNTLRDLTPIVISE